MRMIKEILRLRYSNGLNQKQISKALGCARSTLQECLQRASTAGLSWPLPGELDDEQLESMLYKGNGATISKKSQPDCLHIHNELKRKGVTLELLWHEYKAEHPDGYGLSQFSVIYRRFEGSLDITMRQNHQAGHKVFSDFAGTTVPIVNPHTGEMHPAHLFVCALGASSYTYCELFWSESSESWCNGHANAFSYFKGCPKIVVPDNPKPVITQACRYEPDVNPSFAQMAAHFGVAVIPARVRRPKDKAKVEAAVGIATRWILAVLRNRTFFSLAEANVAVKELLVKLNQRPFTKLPGSRLSAYEEYDKPALQPLPAEPYEYRHIKKATVHIDYHVEFEGHLYSVPYQNRGRTVEVHAGKNTVEIFLSGRRIASHVRSFSKGAPTTLPEHMPKNHRQYADWSPERLINWASKSGPCTAELVRLIMDKRKYPEQGYRSCLGILYLSKTIGNERLEAACKRAVAANALSYKSVKSILDVGLDKRPLPQKPRQLVIVHSNIRGAASFTTAN